MDYRSRILININSEPVKVELAQVMAEYSVVILPVKLGVVSYEDNFEDAMKNMKAAGIKCIKCCHCRMPEPVECLHG